MTFFRYTLCAATFCTSSHFIAAIKRENGYRIIYDGLKNPAIRIVKKMSKLSVLEHLVYKKENVAS